MQYQLVLKGEPKITLLTKVFPDSFDPEEIKSPTKNLSKEDIKAVKKIKMNMFHMTFVSEFIDQLKKETTENQINIIYSIVEKVNNTEILKNFKENRVSKVREYIRNNKFEEDIYMNSEIQVFDGTLKSLI